MERWKRMSTVVYRAVGATPMLANRGSLGRTRRLQGAKRFVWVPISQLTSRAARFCAWQSDRLLKLVLHSHRHSAWNQDLGR